MAQDFEDVTPVSPPAPAGQTASGGDTATNQGDPNANVDIARGPTLGGDVQSGTIDMAGPGSGVSAAATVTSNPSLDEEKVAAPTTSKADPAVTDQPGTPPIDVAPAPTDAIIEGAGRVTEGTGPASLAGGITAPAVSSSGSGSDDDQDSNKEEKKTKDVNDYPLDSPEPPPPGINRLLKDGNEYNKVEANAQVIENPNQEELGTLNQVRMIQGAILAAETNDPNIKIDTSLIKVGEGQLATGVAELEIARQIEEQKKAQEAQAELDKIEAEKAAKAATEMAADMMTQMLIGKIDWTQSMDGVGRDIREVNGAQGNGQGPGTHSLRGHLAKESPLHKDNLPKMPPGVNGAEVSALLAFVNPGSLQAPGYGALGTGTNHGLGGTGLGQDVGGPSQIT